MAFALAEGFTVRSGISFSAAAADLDLMGELGVPRVNFISLETDAPRALDELVRLTLRAILRGIDVVTEFVPRLPIGCLQDAIAAVRYVNHPDDAGCPIIG